MLNNREILEQYLSEADLEGRLTFRNDVSLKDVSSFKVGGNAEFGIYPNTKDELASLCALCRSISVPFIVVGNASNLVFDDSGYEGAVLFTNNINKISINGNYISADCGLPLSRLCLIASAQELSGIEFAYGIPGTVGGAVFMNAGAYGGEFKDVICEVTYYDTEEDDFFTVKNEECSFGYRKSIFQDNNKIILSTTIKLSKSDKDQIQALMHDYMQRRRDKQPLNYPSAGSVFKRPEGYFAGKLIEDSMLKGHTVGGAQVSEKHAGFIINIGNATASDIKTLVEHIITVVKEKFSVDLECEIRFVNNPSEVKT